MTQPANPPVTTSTPAPPSPQVSPTPEPIKPRETRTSKSYQTGSRMRGVVPQPSPPGAASPATATASTPKPAPASPQAGSLPSPGSSPAAGADSAAAPVAGVTDAPAAHGGEAKPDDAPVTPDGLEVAKRLAVIQRAEKAVAESKREHAAHLAVAGELTKAFGALPSVEQVRQLTQQVRLVSQGRADAAKDPVGWLSSVMGVPRDAIVRQAIDLALAEGAKKPEQRLAERVQTAEERLAAYERQAQEGLQRQQQEQQQAQVRDYVQGTLRPIVAGDACKTIRRFCEMTGADPAVELYNAVVERYRSTGKVQDPAALANEIEGSIRARYPELGGANAAPAAPAPQANRTRNGTPTAPTAPRRTPTATEPLRRQKIVSRPYSTSTR